MTIDDLIEQLRFNLRDSPITRTRVNQIIRDTMQKYGILNREVAIFALANNHGINITKLVPDELKGEVEKCIRLLSSVETHKTTVITTPRKTTKTAITKKSKYKYLDIKILPDNFYIKLQDQINDAYNCKIYVAVEILVRKFMENLVIDILRKRYGDRPPGLDIYYNKDKKRFHDFNMHLKTLEEKADLDDFAGSPISDKSFLRKIAKYKDIANKTAHTLEIDKTKEEVDKDKGNVQNILEILIRALNIIR